MDPWRQFCHNPACPARGQVGQGTITVHSQKERRSRCRTGGTPFAATAGTPFSRLRSAADLVTTVLTVLSHGCPLQAVVAAFGVDERTVAAWLARAGQHCAQVQQHLVAQGHLELGHVQADARWVTLVGRRVWLALAMALAVPSRLWLGGVIRPQRDGVLITSLVRLVRACAAQPAILVCVDGLASDVSAFRRVFREPVRTGRRGRPRLVLPAGFVRGQVVTRSAKRRVVSVTQRVVQGTMATIATVLAATGGGTVINTASIERQGATSRAHLAPLARRGRALARTDALLTAGMDLVGCADNVCWTPDSLRLPAPGGTPTKWRERTPALAAGLTDHPWTIADLLHYQVPLPPWVAPTRRGRPPKHPAPPPWALAA
jgi:transposase-like protein